MGSPRRKDLTHVGHNHLFDGTGTRLCLAVGDLRCSLIVEAAARGGYDEHYTEVLDVGQVIRYVTIVNFFT